MSIAGRIVCKALIRVGNSLTVIGCAGLLPGLADIIPAQLFAIGISSGMRVIGSVAVAGRLPSARGYGAIEHLDP